MRTAATGRDVRQSAPSAVPHDASAHRPSPNDTGTGTDDTGVNIDVEYTGLNLHYVQPKRADIGPGLLGLGLLGFGQIGPDCKDRGLHCSDAHSH